MSDAPSLRQILDSLIKQVRVAKLYLDIAKGLLNADPVMMQIAPTFFNSTIAGCSELAQSIGARLYDRTHGAVTVRAILYRSACEPDFFQRTTRQRLEEAILSSVQRIIALQPILDSIRERRNKWLAHLDPATVIDPMGLAERAKLSFSDLDHVFAETEKMLLELSRLFDGTIGELRFLGGDDYKVALDGLRKFKCAEIKDYEKEYGSGSFTGPRPKNCP